MRYKVGDKIKWQKLGPDIVNQYNFNTSKPFYPGRIIYIDNTTIGDLKYFVEISYDLLQSEGYVLNSKSEIGIRIHKVCVLKEDATYRWFAELGLEPWQKVRCNQCV